MFWTPSPSMNVSSRSVIPGTCRLENNEYVFSPESWTLSSMNDIVHYLSLGQRRFYEWPTGLSLVQLHRVLRAVVLGIFGHIRL